MKSIPLTETNENLRTMFNAIVDYHNNLLHARFTVAGLYLAATSFLVSSWFSGLGSQESYYPIPILGLTLTLVCWLLEMRTYQLMSNLGTTGAKIEKKLMLRSEMGFFSLMANQTIAARLPIIRLKLPRWKFIQYIISHSFGLDLLYAFILIFWIYILWPR